MRVVSVALEGRLLMEVVYDDEEIEEYNEDAEEEDFEESSSTEE